MANSIKSPSSNDWFREWIEQQNRKREEKARIQLEFPLPELIEQSVKPIISNRGVYDDALKSVVEDAVDSCVVNTITFQF